MARRQSLRTMRLAAHRFDRTGALVDGSVRLDNVVVIKVPTGRAQMVGLLHGVFDAAEVPLSQYVFWVARGEPVTAIPVFPDRLFTYPYIYTRPDTGISGLSDLRGRRVVMVPRYFSTPCFWQRALLKDVCGISPNEIEWYTTSPEPDERMKIPQGVRVTVRPGSIHGLERLLDGTGECLMAARTPPVAPAERSRVRRVEPDVHVLQLEWYRRTSFHPILHIIALRREALVKRPEFGVELCQAYDAAKAWAYHIVQDERMTCLPFMREFLDVTMERCGDDPWPYGLERNRAELERFLDLAHDQGFTDRRLSLDELFDERAISYQFTARMVPGSIVGVADGGWVETSVYPDR